MERRSMPTEKEIDDLIAGGGERTSRFLQLPKETGIRAKEAWNLKWIDMDFTNSTVKVTPQKGSTPRMFKVLSKLLAMLTCLPRKLDCVFGGYELRGFNRSWQRQRIRKSRKLGNPRLQQITFHTLRHWKAIMEYHETKDILYVMRFLGHKNIKNALILLYTARHIRGR
jgi:integrase